MRCVLLAGLYRDMYRKLYGQHLVRDVVGTLVEAHIDNHQPSKALVLSFHGSTGVGKNYVSTMIANRLYKRGMQSKFVKLYQSTVDFHSNKDVNGYKVRKWLLELKYFINKFRNPTLCPKNRAKFGKPSLRQAWTNFDNFRSTASHTFNKNLAIANRSRVSWAHNTLRAPIGLNIAPWPWNLG